MKVIRKINNNVAECIDNKGRHLIAFGKGIGYQRTPYELDDLNKIEMTFYQLNNHYEKLISEIPETIFMISSQIVKYVQRRLSGELSPTLVISLADHIAFAIKKLEKNQRSYFYANDLAALYPKETVLARYAVKYIDSKLGIKLPPCEVSNITMHFVNAQQETELDRESQLVEDLLVDATQRIENKLNIIINIEDYSYTRFRMHFRYFLTRIKENKSVDKSDSLYEELKERNPEIYSVVTEICEETARKVNVRIPENEQVYMMIHVARLYEKNKEND